MKSTAIPKRGDRVVILQARHWSEFSHRKLPIYGRVTWRDGGYVFVRPSRCKWEIECYDNELRVANSAVKLPRWVSQRSRNPVY